MTIYGIQEPESFNPSSAVAVGIDLGTTHSLIGAVQKNGQVKLFCDEHGSCILPSVVTYLSDQTLIGEAARKEQSKYPLDTFSSMKRLMGRERADVTDWVQLPSLSEDAESISFKSKQGDKTPVHVASDLLKCLMDRAIAQSDVPISGAVITVPAYFDERARQATKQAARLAGIEVLRLINEPTAASLALNLTEDAPGITLVYDFGGGTFDATILRTHAGLFEVLGTAGDTQLGGDDIDRALMQYIIDYLDLEPTVAISSSVLALARQAKESLSDAESVDIVLQGHGCHLTQEDLSNISAPLIARTVSILHQSLEDAQLVPADIDRVILVGGSSLLLQVRQTLELMFNCPILIDEAPIHTVAIGAAKQADRLRGHHGPSQPILLDVIPLSIGLEMMGGVNEKMILRNSTLPTSVTHQFTTYQDNQTAIALHVVQGEREMAKDCQSLVRCSLPVPALPAGHVKADVTFTIDVDGLLTLEAVESVDKKSISIEVKPMYGLTDDALEQMVQSAVVHASEDIHAKNIATHAQEANAEIAALEKMMSVDDEVLLPPEERARIQKVIDDIHRAIRYKRLSELKKARNAFEKTIEPYLDRRLQVGLNNYLKGKRVTEVSE